MPKANGLRVIPKFATSFGHTTFSIFFKAVYRYLLLDSYFWNGDAIHTRPLHSTTLQSSVIERTRPFQAVCCCCAQEQDSTLSFVLIYWKTAVECYKTSTKSWRIEYYNLFFSSNWCDKKVVVSMFWSILPNLVRLSYCHNGFFGWIF